jgi:hypothetical protein
LTKIILKKPNIKKKKKRKKTILGKNIHVKPKKKTKYKCEGEKKR